MHDFDQFERRLAAALRSDADVSVGPFEAESVARAAIAGTRRAMRLPRGRGITLLAAAALLLVGGGLAAGSGLLRLPSIVPSVPEPSVIAVATASPDAAMAAPLPKAIAGILPADMEPLLVEKQFTCTPRVADADERFHVDCQRGINYRLVWSGRDPTSVYSVDATVTGVSESYAASFIGNLIDMCTEDLAGLEAWAFLNVHSGGEATIGRLQLRLTVVSEGTWRIEITAA